MVFERTREQTAELAKSLQRWSRERGRVQDPVGKKRSCRKYGLTRPWSPVGSLWVISTDKPYSVHTEHEDTPVQIMCM